MICHGNICRSPIAAACFSRSIKGIDFVSAGIGARAGLPADPLAIEICQKSGMDISHHRSRNVDETILRNSDLALAMESEHVLVLKTRYPWATGRIWRLGHHLGLDFPDIYGKSAEAFQDFLHSCSLSLPTWEPILRS